jgi:tRNA1Val (adenine37-N6)-methyltransferase
VSPIFEENCEKSGKGGASLPFSAVRAGENIVDLRWRGLKLLQNPRFFSFSTDSLLLAEFVGARPQVGRICDLGSGNGGLLLLLWALNPKADCTGLEIMPANVDLARRSLLLNGKVQGLAGHCRFEQGDWRQPEKYFAAESFDLLVSNPPYQPQGSGRVSPVLERRAARSEVFGTFADLAKSAAWLLCTGGSFCFVLPRWREEEAAKILQAVGMAIVRAEHAGRNDDLVLIECQKLT